MMAQNLLGLGLLLRQLAAALYHLAGGRTVKAQARFASACIARLGLRSGWRAPSKSRRELRALDRLWKKRERHTRTEGLG